MDEDEATGSLKKLEGRVRALEALLLEMPELTTERVEAAQERVRENVRSQQRGRFRGLHEKMERLTMFLDEDAEVAPRRSRTK